MSDLIEKLILKKHPNYDFERYRFKAGDIVETLDGATIVVRYSACEYVEAYVIRKSLKYREKGLQNIKYDGLPYYKKGTFTNKLPKITRRLEWKVYDFVHLDNGNITVLLSDKVGHQAFYGYVLSSENNYYLHTNIYLENHFKDYVMVGGT